MYRRFTLALLGWLSAASALLGGGASAQAAPDPSNAAWAAIRARFPAEQLLPRPTWLPDRFTKPGVASDNGLFFGVLYTSDEGDTLLFGRTGNSCALPAGDISQTVQPLLVQGVIGALTINTRPDCSPRLLVSWRIGDETYSIQANAGPSETVTIPGDLLVIIAGLAATLPDGAPAPTPLLSGRPDSIPFRETGQRIAGPFREYWEAHGGLALNGYPLTGEMVEQLEDGRLYQVQYFERVRLEFHPEIADPAYRVLLGQFGRRVLAGVPDAPTAVVPAQDGYTYFRETGHNVGPRFGAYWQANGGVMQFGFPLTELFEQRLEDGKTYQVQYFERARLEWHPDTRPGYQVLLGQFGRGILSGGATRTLVLDPASGPCPDARTSVVARGGGFAPGVVTRFTIRRDRDGEFTGDNSTSGGQPANADGSYESTIPLSGCGPDEPVGSTFTITVAEYYPDRTPVNGRARALCSP